MYFTKFTGRQRTQLRAKYLKKSYDRIAFYLPPCPPSPARDNAPTIKFSIKVPTGEYKLHLPYLPCKKLSR